MLLRSVLYKHKIELKFAFPIHDQSFQHPSKINIGDANLAL